MPDLFAQAAAWQEQQRAAYLASPVTYVRGSLSAAVNATIGKTTFEVENGYGILDSIESRDFLILASDLLMAGFGDLTPEQLAALSPAELDELLAAETVTPLRGDLIQETFGSKTLSYEVNSPGTTQPWRWSDPYRNTLRIHTKLVQTTG